MPSLIHRLRAGIITASADETRALGAALARELPADTTLALHGDLGVGKTTFVQGLAQGIGVPEPVTSPTFAIYSVHRGTDRTLVHLDAYRLERASQLDDLLLDEFLENPWMLAVEWPDRVAGWLPAGTRHLTLAIVDGDRHQVRLD